MTEEEKAAAVAAEGGDGTEKKNDDGAEDDSAKAERLEAELKEANTKLKKLEGKDINFGNLKKQTEDDQKKHGEEKEALSSKVKELETQIETNRQAQIDDWYDSVLHVSVGGDDDRKKKVRAEYDLLNMPATTREEVTARIDKAMKLAGYERMGDVGAVSFGSGREPERKEVRHHETDSGKRLTGVLAPDLVRAQEAAKNNDR